MDRIYEGMFEKVFGATMGSAADKLRLAFGRVSYSGLVKGRDLVGQEGMLGRAVSDPRLHTTASYEIVGEKLASSSKPFNISSSSFLERGQAASSKLSNLLQHSRFPDSSVTISHFWDTELPERFGYATRYQTNVQKLAGGKSHVGPAFNALKGADMAPLVSVKQMMHEFFPGLTDVVATSSRQEDVVKAIQFGSKDSHYFHDAAAALGKDLGKLSKEEQLAVFVRAAYEKAAETPGGLMKFKLFYSKRGVRNLQNVQNKIFDPMDPYNLLRYMDNINALPKGISDRAARRAIHIAGRENLSEFVQHLSGRFGREYASEFGKFASTVMEESGDARRVALLLTENDRLFIGDEGIARRYFPLPASDRGIITYNGKKYGARNLLLRDPISGKLETANPAIAFLHKFFTGFKEKGAHGGLEVATALESGFGAAKGGEYLRSVGRPGTASNWNAIKEPVVSMGQRSLYPGVFGFRTSALTEGVAMEKTFEAFAEGFSQVGGARVGRNVPGLEETFIEGIRADTKRLQREMGFRPGSYPYWGLKAKERGLVALPGMSSLRPMGPTFRELTKGIYQERGKREAISPAVHANVKATLARIGYQQRLSPIGTTAFEATTRRTVSDLWSKELGKRTTAAVYQPYMLGVIRPGTGSADALRIAKTFGEAGVYRTPLGAKAFAERIPTETLSVSMTQPEAEQALRRLAGARFETKPWQKFTQAALTGGTAYGSAQLADDVVKSRMLAPGVRLPTGAQVLTGMSFSDYTGKLTMSFASEMMPGGANALLISGARMTQRAVSPENIRAIGPLGRLAHGITSQENVARIGTRNLLFEHMTGLLGTPAGQQMGGVEEFMRRWGPGGGLRLAEVGGEQTIMMGGRFTPRHLGRMHKVLAGMGFSALTLKGDFASIRELTEATLENTQALAGQRLYITSAARRFQDRADQLKNTKAMSARLQTLSVTAAGIPRLHGMKTAWEHPGWAKMASTLERRRGLTINRGTSGPFLTGAPEEYANIYRAVSPGFEPPAGRTMSLAQAQEKFVFGNRPLTIEAFNKGGLSMDEIMETDFMKPGRAGFWLEFDDPMQFSRRATPQMSENLFSSRFLYVPSSDVLRGISGDVPVARGSLLHSLVGLVEGESKIGNTASYTAAAWRAFAGLGGREGFLSENLFSSGAMAGAAKARVVPEERLMTGMSQKARDMFEIGMSPSTLDKMMRSEATFDGALDQKLYGKLKRDLARGQLYGIAMPTPTHGGGHMTTVKFYQDLALGAEMAAERDVAMHPLHAMWLNRDFDKDVAETMLVSDKRMAKLYRKQRKRLAPQMRALEQALTVVEQRMGPTGAAAGKAEFQTMLSYFGFGNLPPLGFLGGYGAFTTGSILSGSATPAQAAAELNKLAAGRFIPGREMTAADVGRYRQLLGTTWARGELLQRNVKQGVIQKAGEGLGPLMENFLTVQSNIVSQYGGGRSLTQTQVDDAMSMAIESTYRYLEGVTGGKVTNEAIFNALKVDLNYGNLTGKALLQAMARDLGTIQGVQGIMLASHSKMTGPQGRLATYGPRNVIREFLGSKEGDMLGAGARLFGVDEGLEAASFDPGQAPDIRMMSASDRAILASSQEEVAGLNRAQQEASEMGPRAKGFLGRNWKVLAGVGVGLLGLREVASAIGGGPTQAPIPRDPMVDVPSGPGMHLDVPTATVMPPNGYSTNAYGHGTTPAVNIDEVENQVRMNIGAVQGGFGTVHINDSREHRSNWELQNAARRQAGSDFIHKYQYN
jgi:hypothetical protein